MEFDDHVARAAFVQYYENDYKAANVDQPQVLCAYKKMWDFIDGDTKKFLFEVIVNLKVTGNEGLVSHREHLESKFKVPFDKLNTKTIASFEGAYFQALQECQKP